MVGQAGRHIRLRPEVWTLLSAVSGWLTDLWGHESDYEHGTPGEWKTPAVMTDTRLSCVLRTTRQALSLHRYEQEPQLMWSRAALCTVALFIPPVSAAKARWNIKVVPRLNWSILLSFKLPSDLNFPAPLRLCTSLSRNKHSSTRQIFLGSCPQIIEQICRVWELVYILSALVTKCKSASGQVSHWLQPGHVR